MKISDLDKIKKMAAEFERFAEVEKRLGWKLTTLDLDIDTGSAGGYKFRCTTNTGVDFETICRDLQLVFQKHRKELQGVLQKINYVNPTDFNRYMRTKERQ